jgi:hypothetical protein
MLVGREMSRRIRGFDTDELGASDRTAMSRCHPDEGDDDAARGEARTRRSRRLVLALIPLMLLAAGSVVAKAYLLFPFCCLPLLILGPALLQHDRPGADDGDGPDDDGGSPPPAIPPGPTGGGLPMPDAGPAARRYRGRPASPLIPVPTRRPAHPPERRPVPRRH